MVIHNMQLYVPLPKYKPFLLPEETYTSELGITAIDIVSPELSLTSNPGGVVESKYLIYSSPLN